MKLCVEQIVCAFTHDKYFSILNWGNANKAIIDAITIVTLVLIHVLLSYLLIVQNYKKLNIINKW